MIQFVEIIYSVELFIKWIKIKYTEYANLEKTCFSINLHVDRKVWF